MKPEIEITRVFDADVTTVWEAITNNDYLKQWYFVLEKFVPEKGFKFSFTGGPDNGIQYNHLCEIVEVIPEKKLAYSWQYEGYEGNSLVVFELFAEGEKTKLVFTHSGLSNFPAENSDFAIGNFEMGWNYFINEALVKFLKNG